jgi:hypothetical protein
MASTSAALRKAPSSRWSVALVQRPALVGTLCEIGVHRPVTQIAGVDSVGIGPSVPALVGHTVDPALLVATMPVAPSPKGAIHLDQG